MTTQTMQTDDDCLARWLGSSVLSRRQNFEPSHGIFSLPQNSDISANFVEAENSPAISTIFDLMTYFYHRKNQTELPKVVGPTNSYRNTAQL